MATRKAEEISGNSGDDNNEVTPVVKKLKSSPTDLIILVGEEKYEYHCHGIYMAFQSDFIDAALASPMRESQTNVIELSDITPKIWGLMMNIINSPLSWKKLPQTGMGDILLAAEKFDKYQFLNGVASCVAKISSGFDALARLFHTDRQRAEMKINSVIKHSLQCANIGLEDAMPSVYAFLKIALSMPMEGKNYFGGLIFKEEQLRRLAPLIVKGRLVGDQWTEEEILCPLFPKHYLDTAMSTYEERRFGPKHQRAHLKVVNVWIKKTKTQKFQVARLHKENTTDTTPWFSGGPTHNSLRVGDDLHNPRIYLRKKTNGGNWVIGAVVEREHEDDTLRILWRCPLSSNFISFPPRKGWVKAHDSAPDGALRVELEEKGIAVGHARRSPPGAFEHIGR